MILQEENAVFIFEKCSYEELQVIQHREDLLLSGWTLLEKEYIDVTEKVYDEDGTMVALINYYFLSENKDRMMIHCSRCSNHIETEEWVKELLPSFYKTIMEK